MGGVGGQYPTLWPVGQSGSGEASRPKASIGWCGGEGIGGQSGEGREKATPSLCGQWVASGRPPRMASRWPVGGQWEAGEGVAPLFPMGAVRFSGQWGRRWA